MKKYTRQGLIRFFSKMPPDKKPCRQGDCPLRTAGFTEDFAWNVDEAFMRAVDDYCSEKLGVVPSQGWHRLTAKQIVQIAKSL